MSYFGLFGLVLLLRVASACATRERRLELWRTFRRRDGSYNHALMMARSGGARVESVVLGNRVVRLTLIWGAAVQDLWLATIFVVTSSWLGIGWTAAIVGLINVAALPSTRAQVASFTGCEAEAALGLRDQPQVALLSAFAYIVSAFAIATLTVAGVLLVGRSLEADSTISGLMLALLGIGAIIATDATSRLPLRVGRTLAENTSLAPLRDYVLFLRSFADDKRWILTRSMGNSIASSFIRTPARLEELLYWSSRNVGDVVAIGKPGERLAQLGALRAYFSDDQWQEAVVNAVDRAQHVVVVLGETPGLRWELETVLASECREKVLLVVPPLKRSATRRVIRVLCDATGHGIESVGFVAEHLIAAGLYPGGTLCLYCSWARTDTAYVAVLSQFRGKEDMAARAESLQQESRGLPPNVLCLDGIPTSQLLVLQNDNASGAAPSRTAIGDGQSAEEERWTRRHAEPVWLSILRPTDDGAAPGFSQKWEAFVGRRSPVETHLDLSEGQITYRFTLPGWSPTAESVTCGANVPWSSVVGLQWWQVSPSSWRIQVLIMTSSHAMLDFRDLSWVAFRWVLFLASAEADRRLSVATSTQAQLRKAWRVGDSPPATGQMQLPFAMPIGRDQVW